MQKAKSFDFSFLFYKISIINLNMLIANVKLSLYLLKDYDFIQ